jgi:hypothetical protein
MKNTVASRRSALKLMSMAAAAAVLGETVAGGADAPALVPLTSDDPTAKALGYVNNTNLVDAATNPTHQPSQHCGTCVQYQGKPGAARGGCNIYPGKSVSVNGWCRVWTAKPAT